MRKPTKPAMPSPAKRRSPRRQTLSGHLPANAAELWAATLPSPSEIAIRDERHRRNDAAYQAAEHLVALVDADLRAKPQHWWSLATIALLAGIVGAAYLACGGLH